MNDPFKTHKWIMPLTLHLMTQCFCQLTLHTNLHVFLVKIIINTLYLTMIIIKRFLI